MDGLDPFCSLPSAEGAAVAVTWLLGGSLTAGSIVGSALGASAEFGMVSPGAAVTAVAVVEPGGVPVSVAGEVCCVSMFVAAFSAVAPAVAAPSGVPVSVCGGVLFAVAVAVSVCQLPAVPVDMPACEVSAVSSVDSDGAICGCSAAVAVLVGALVAVGVAVIPVSVFGVGTAACVIAATTSLVVLAVAAPSGVPVSVCGGVLFAVAVAVSVCLLSAAPADAPAGVLSAVSSVDSDGAFCECATVVVALVGASASACVAAVIPVSVSGVGVSSSVSVLTPVTSVGMLMFIIVIMLASSDSAAGKGVALGLGELPVSANAATWASWISASAISRHSRSKLNESEMLI
jgi:hypothetical protein